MRDEAGYSSVASRSRDVPSFPSMFRIMSLSREYQFTSTAFSSPIGCLLPRRLAPRRGRYGGTSVLRDRSPAVRVDRPGRAPQGPRPSRPGVRGAGPADQVIDADRAISHEQFSRLEPRRQAVIPVHRLDRAEDARLGRGELGGIRANRIDLDAQGRSNIGHDVTRGFG